MAKSPPLRLIINLPFSDHTSKKIHGRIAGDTHHHFSLSLPKRYLFEYKVKKKKSYKLYIKGKIYLQMGKKDRRSIKIYFILHIVLGMHKNTHHISLQIRRIPTLRLS